MYVAVTAPAGGASRYFVARSGGSACSAVSTFASSVSAFGSEASTHFDGGAAGAVDGAVVVVGPVEAGAVAAAVGAVAAGAVATGAVAAPRRRSTTISFFSAGRVVGCVVAC